MHRLEKVTEDPRFGSAKLGLFSARIKKTRLEHNRLERVIYVNAMLFYRKPVPCDYEF